MRSTHEKRRRSHSAAWQHGGAAAALIALMANPAAAPAQTAAVAPAPGQAAQPPKAAAPVPATATAAQSARVHFSGSGTLGDRLVPDLVDAWLASGNLHAKGWARTETQGERVQEAKGQDGREMRVTVAHPGAAGPFVVLNEQKTDVVMSSRAPNPAELAGYRTGHGLDANAAPTEHVLALDGVAVVVNAENPVTRLKVEQIRDIFAGAIANWSAVGGPDLPIKVIGREGTSSTGGFFAASVMGKAAIASTAERVDSHPAASNAVAGDIGAIGFVPFAFVGASRPMNILSSCGLEFEASEFGLKTEDYPLSRRLNLYTGPRLTKEASEFIRYATSSSGYDVVRDAGYVSLQPARGTREYTQFRLADAVEATPSGADLRYAEAMQEYNLATRHSHRLSTTFRFAHGSAQLDARGREDVERVAEFLRRPENQARKVHVLGFTDSSGAFGQNRYVSNQRANEVANQLRQRGAKVAQAKGLGPVAPVACDDDPNTAVRNRRVEIWVAD